MFTAITRVGCSLVRKAGKYLPFGKFPNTALLSSKCNKATIELASQNIPKTTTAQIGKLTEKAQEVKSNISKPLFCEEYWSNAFKGGSVKTTQKKFVNLHEYLNSINPHCLLSSNPKEFDEIVPQTGKTIREMIRETDREFKTLKQTEGSFKVYRAIGEKPDFFNTYPLYRKAKSVKSGDIIDMKEYAYATSDKSYANSYLTNNNGIPYEIEIPAKSKVSRTGDRLSTDEVIFPRASKFLCTEVEHILDANSDYMLVKCKYIHPTNIFPV